MRNTYTKIFSCNQCLPDRGGLSHSEIKNKPKNPPHFLSILLTTVYVSC